MKTTKKELLEKITRLESQIEEARNERKKMFNKYDFLNDLAEEIKKKIEDESITDKDEVREYIQEEIDRECIYHGTCFEIAMELNATDFTGFNNFGEITNISGLAYAALDEYVNEEFNFTEMNDLIEAKQNEEVSE